MQWLPAGDLRGRVGVFLLSDLGILKLKNDRAELVGDERIVYRHVENLIGYLEFCNVTFLDLNLMDCPPPGGFSF